LERARIFLLFRFRRLILFFLHFALMLSALLERARVRSVPME
jgi:hypothetical protein